MYLRYQTTTNPTNQDISIDQQQTNPCKNLNSVAHHRAVVSAFVKKPKPREAEEGSSVIFEAETEKSGAKVKWQCGAKDVVNSKTHAIAADGTKHSLTIAAVTQGDANVYAVIAGGSKVKFELKVRAKPGGNLLMLQVFLFWEQHLLTGAL